MSDEMKKDQSTDSFGDGIPVPSSQEEDQTLQAPTPSPLEQQASETTKDEGSTDDEETLSPEQERFKNLVITVLRTVFDPEIPVNIYELGLIYDVKVTPSHDVTVRFTLTSPNCPAAQDLPMEMERKIQALEGVGRVEMVLTWEPTWTPDMMTEAAKLQLNMF